MGALIQEHDWSPTPLGPIGSWPDPLRAATSIMLRASWPVAIFWGPDLRLLYNDAWRDLIGDKHPQALGQPLGAVFPEIWDALGPMTAEVLASGRAVDAEDRLLPLNRNGQLEEAYFTFSFSPIPDETGRAAGILNLTHETTAKVRAEAARERAERAYQDVAGLANLSTDFRALFEASPTPFLVLSPALEIIAVNDAYLGATMTRRADILGRPLFEAFPDNPDEPGATGVSNLRASLERVLATRRPDAMAVQKYDVRRPPDQGGGFEERWWSPLNSPVLGPDGEVACIIHRVVDVTDLKRGQAAIRESEERFRLMADIVPQIVWTTDSEGRLEFFNRQWSRYTGVPQEETTAAAIAADFLHPDDAGPTMAAFDAARRTGHRFHVEHRIRSATGEYRWFLVQAEPFRDQRTGEIVRWYGASVDIHDRKQTEAALRENGRRLQATWDHVGVGILEVDREGRALNINSAFTRITGFALEDISNVALVDLIADETERENARALHAALVRGEIDQYSTERLYTNKHGRTWWGEINATAVRDEAGEFLYGIRIVRDVSERKQAEARQALLAREVDHRARNALAVVQALVRMSRAEGPDEYRRAVEGRVAALARAHSLLSAGRWSGGDLRTLAAEELAPYLDPADERVTLSGPEIALVPDAVQPVSMVLHELATNAAKHGALSAPGGRVAVAWSDRGGGLTLEWRETGGPPVGGIPARRGFGSQMIQAAAAQIGGAVSFDWRPAGLRCVLTVAADGARQAIRGKGAAAEPEAESPASGRLDGCHVLVVEDDALLALDMREALEAAGCAVVGPAGTLGEALRLAVDAPRLDAAVLDVNLCGREVWPAADVLQARGVPCLFTTGYERDARTRGAPVLQKPIVMGRLPAALAKALAAE